MYAAAELSAVKKAVVLVANTVEGAERANVELPDVPIVKGDPTEDDVLIAAGIERASGLVACTESDNDNVVVTLTGRQLNPNIRIVARIQDVDHEAKVRKVGADAVVSPQHTGGLRLASELVRPTVVTFLDTMLKDRDLNLRIDEVRIPDGSPAIGKRITDIGLEKLPQVLLLAVREGDGHWQYNPPRSYELKSGVVLIFLGTPEDSRMLHEGLAAERVSESAVATS